MSEFSDAYYLLDVERSAARALVRRVGRFALLFPTLGRWTPTLIEGAEEAGGPSSAFLEHAACTWMHYAFAEDHGLWLKFFDGADEIAQVELHRQGPSELDVERVLAALGALFDRQDQADLRAALEAAVDSATDLADARRRLSIALGVELMVNASCADLTHLSLKELERVYPDAERVLKSKRGKYRAPQAQPEPNEFCPVPGAPPFMYLPLPDGDADAEMVERHVRHWVETGDFDDDTGEGFWLYNAYRRALPTRYRFLADRMMNMWSVFLGDEVRIRDTVRAILAVTDEGFEWEPYLARSKGGMRC